MCFATLASLLETRPTPSNSQVWRKALLAPQPFSMCALYITVGQCMGSPAVMSFDPPMRERHGPGRCDH
jgi:hypothetical protein